MESIEYPNLNIPKFYLSLTVYSEGFPMQLM